jgi:hypothetical protein
LEAASNKRPWREATKVQRGKSQTPKKIQNPNGFFTALGMTGKGSFYPHAIICRDSPSQNEVFDYSSLRFFAVWTFGLWVF